MGIQLLFILTVVALPLLGYVFLQWLGGEKPPPTIRLGETHDKSSSSKSPEDSDSGQESE